jgi:hypothetical protein
MLTSCPKSQTNLDPIASILDSIDFQIYKEMPPLPLEKGVTEKNINRQGYIIHYVLVDTVRFEEFDQNKVPIDFNFVRSKNNRIKYDRLIMVKSNKNQLQQRNRHIQRVELSFSNGYFNKDKTKFFVIMNHFRTSKDAASTIFLGTLIDGRWQWDTVDLYIS